MDDDARDLGPYFDEFEAQVRELADVASQAARAYADGDDQAACDAVNLSHHNVDRVEDLRQNLFAMFRQRRVRSGM